MARSNNSRKGSTNKHGKRHNVCCEGPTCPYCASNLKHAAKKQRLKGSDG